MPALELLAAVAAATEVVYTLASLRYVSAFYVGRASDWLKREAAHRSRGYTLAIPIRGLLSLAEVCAFEAALIAQVGGNPKCRNKAIDSRGARKEGPSTIYVVLLLIGKLARLCQSKANRERVRDALLVTLIGSLGPKLPNDRRPPRVRPQSPPAGSTSPRPARSPRGRKSSRRGPGDTARSTISGST